MVYRFLYLTEYNASLLVIAYKSLISIWQRSQLSQIENSGITIWHFDKGVT